jgi:signal-transduction protein with cAMP-binding, CBS, and nucleotidyltransferase domain
VSADYLTKVMVTGKSSASIKVSSIMTPANQLRSLTPQHSVLEAMELMVDNNVRHVPVVSEGEAPHVPSQQSNSLQTQPPSNQCLIQRVRDGFALLH